jgi:hypothetical protein
MMLMQMVRIRDFENPLQLIDGNPTKDNLNNSLEM